MNITGDKVGDIYGQTTDAVTLKLKLELMAAKSLIATFSSTSTPTLTSTSINGEDIGSSCGAMSDDDIDDSDESQPLIPLVFTDVMVLEMGDILRGFECARE